MVDEKKKKISGVLSIISLILLLIALLFGVSCIRVGIQNYVAIDNVDIERSNFAAEIEETKGNIASIALDKITVEYTVEDVAYKTDQQVYTDAYSVGDEVKVYYSTEDPTVCRVPELFAAYYSKVGNMMLKNGIIIVGVCCTLGIILLSIAYLLKKPPKNR